MSNLNEHFSSRQLSRAGNICSNAVGMTLKVRRSKTACVTGTIIEASPSHVTFKGRTAHLVFKVVMECGEAKARKEVHVCQLPRA